MEMEYGKEITTRSFFKGKPTKEQLSYIVPILVKNKTEALGEIIKALELIERRQTKKVTLTISSDKTYQLKMITAEYSKDDLTNAQ